MDELQISQSNVNVIPGEIEFNNYDEILDQANQLVGLMKTSVVTEETVKANKKLLAEVRKQKQLLLDDKKSVKATLTKPFEDYESQVKGIVETIESAEGYVDEQVKELAKIQRDKKLADITELFNLRKGMYENFPLVIENFLTEYPKSLNQSESMNKVEKCLGIWFESKQDDLSAISNLPNAEEVMTEYISHPDSLSRVMSLVSQREEQKKQAQKVVQKNNSTKKEYSFKVFNEEDAQTLETYMNETDIKYTTY